MPTLKHYKGILISIVGNSSSIVEDGFEWMAVFLLDGPKVVWSKTKLGAYKKAKCAIKDFKKQIIKI